MEANHWTDDIMRKVDNQKTNEESRIWETQSIYRIHDSFNEFYSDPTDENMYPYTPQKVSFGPFHHGQEHLKPMEEHKTRSLVHFLTAADKHVQVFLNALGGVVEQLKERYGKLDEKWSSKHGDEFLRVMLFDGCFMIEILRTANGSNGYADKDPDYRSHWKLYTLPFIKRDMLLLENQIPLLVLEKLIEAETGQTVDYRQLNELVLRLWSRGLLADEKRHAHVLDIFRDSMVRKSQLEHQLFVKRGRSNSTVVPEERRSPVVEPIQLATKLHEAGVKFTKSKTDSLQDITFNNRTLSLPVIRVDDFTESMLLNLIAFERSQVGAGNFVTSYVVFMDHLLDTPKDVSLLQSQGIIEIYYGSNEAVAQLFNDLSKDVMLDSGSEINQIRTMLNKHCKKKWNVWRANLVHTYCNTPWKILSLMGAIFLLVLTLVQTVYTVLGFYRSKK